MVQRSLVHPTGMEPSKPAYSQHASTLLLYFVKLLQSTSQPLRTILLILQTEGQLSTTKPKEQHHAYMAHNALPRNNFRLSHSSTKHCAVTTAGCQTTQPQYPQQCVYKSLSRNDSRHTPAQPRPHSIQVRFLASGVPRAICCCSTSAAAAAAAAGHWLHKGQRLCGRCHHFGAAFKAGSFLEMRPTQTATRDRKGQHTCTHHPTQFKSAPWTAA